MMADDILSGIPTANDLKRAAKDRAQVLEAMGQCKVAKKE